jgi:hypothetical protein
MTRVVYWIGWIMAVVAYLAILADLALLAFSDDYHSWLVALVSGEGLPVVVVMAYATITIIFLMAED